VLEGSGLEQRVAVIPPALEQQGKVILSALEGSGLVRQDGARSWAET